VPPLHGDEIARPKLMEDLVGTVTRPEALAVGMATGLWGAGGVREGDPSHETHLSGDP
jgi:hypothetical protein